MSIPAPSDPHNPATKPQGTLRDQQQNMESEGQPVAPPPEPEPAKDPAVDAAAIFEKLEDQAASERGEPR